MSLQTTIFTGFEAEDSGSPVDIIPALKATLKPLLEAEISRVEKERDFLRTVYRGSTGGAELENVSTVFVDSFLLGLESRLFGV